MINYLFNSNFIILFLMDHCLLLLFLLYPIYTSLEVLKHLTVTTVRNTGSKKTTYYGLINIQATVKIDNLSPFMSFLS